MERETGTGTDPRRGARAGVRHRRKKRGAAASGLRGAHEKRFSLAQKES